MSLSKAALAELIGTFTLTFIGAGAGAAAGSNAGVPGLISVALAHGVALMIIVYTWGTVSGAHVNPAVTLGVLFGGKIDLGKAIVYWIAQFLGAIAAAYVLLHLVGFDALRLGQTLGKFSGSGGLEVDPIRTVVLEAILTFFLVSAVMSCGIFNNFGNAVGLAIGFVLTADILCGGPYTGASMNPARSLGPFLALNNLGPFWMYLVGPAIGGAIAGLLYGFVIEKKQ
jgi:MIP family channel proteins